MLIIWYLNQNYEFSFYNNFFLTNYLIFFFFLINITYFNYYFTKYLIVLKIKTDYICFKILKLNLFFIFFKLNNNFIKEGFYIDLIQKLNLNNWIKNFLYTSTQVFNLNFLNNWVIKFTTNYIIQFVNNLLTSSDNINLYQIFFNIFILFIIVWHFYYIVLLNIYIIY